MRRGKALAVGIAEDAQEDETPAPAPRAEAAPGNDRADARDSTAAAQSDEAHQASAAPAPPRR